MLSRKNSHVGIPIARPSKHCFSRLVWIVASLSTVLVTVILARCLSVEDFGLHKKALLAFSVCSPALASGLLKALFFFRQETRRMVAHSCSEPSMSLLSGLAFATGLTLVVGDHVALQLGDERLADLWWMIGIYALGMLPLGSVSATLVATERVGWMVIFQSVSQVVLVGLIWVAASLTQDVQFTVGAMMVWSLLTCGIAIVLMLKATVDAGHVRIPETAHYILQLRYAVPLGLASMFGSISTQFDKLVVSSMCSAEAFALYVAGAIEIPIIGIVTGAMNAAILPNLSVAYKKGRLAEIVDLWKRAMGKAALLLIPCMGAILSVKISTCCTLKTTVLWSRYVSTPVCYHCVARYTECSNGNGPHDMGHRDGIGRSRCYVILSADGSVARLVVGRSLGNRDQHVYGGSDYVAYH